VQAVRVVDGTARATFERCSARLWRSIVAWSGSRDVADDAVAEAFAQLLRRGDEVVDPERWVWRAAFRIAAGELQRRRRVVPLAVDGSVDEPALPVDPALLAALASLSPQQRACLVLRDVGGLTPTEVADALGTSAGTVRVQHLAARRRLRALLPDPSEASDDP
jgi:RNA polymerase sigma-70 factor (ECF subfamily)